MAILDIPFDPNNVADEIGASEALTGGGDAVGIADLPPIAITASASPLKVGADIPFDPKASPFAQAADALVAAGWTILPVAPRDKAPGEFRGSIEHGSWAMMTGWNDYAHSKPSEASISRWKTWPDANIGVVLGGDHNGYAVIAIDFDTDIDDELELLAGSIPPSPMRKMGSRGFTAFYRGSKDLKTKRYMIAAPTAEKPNAKRTVLEILTGNAPRQTVMPPSMHPHGRPYEYITGNGVVPVARLPVLTQDHLDVLEDNLAHLGWSGDDVARPDRATRGSPVDDDNIWRETNNIALDNLDMWVGSLGLPKLKRHGNGSWEAVPSFRPSNSGTPLMQRKSNLKFHRSGVKDMGVDEGFTPIDVVVAAFSWDFDSAFHWLRGKLGIKDPDDSFFQLPIPPMTLTETDDGDLMDSMGEVVEAAPENVLLELPDHLTRLPGLLGEMIDFTEASAIFPNRSLSMAASITALSTIIGRRDSTPKRGALNLYVLALAPTGGGKQHGISAARAFIREAGATKHIGTGDYMSQSAFYNRMKKQPLTFSATDEFGFFLQRLNANNAGAWDVGLKKVMLETWGANFETMISSGTAAEDGVPIEAPTMSIYGVSTPDMFYKAVQGADSVNGMLNRFLLIATGVRSEETDPEHFLSEMPKSLLRKLDRAYRVRRPPRLQLLGDAEPEADDEIDPGDIMLIVPWGVGAHEVYKAFSKECRTRGDSNVEIAPFFARSAEIALRLATIRAVGCDLDYPSVSAADMQWGIDLARWSAERMADDAGDLVSDTPYTAINSRILAKMKQARGLPTKERDLQRASGIGGDAFKKHLKDLHDMGRIVPVEIITRGQKSKAWKLVSNDNTARPAPSTSKKKTK